MTLLDELLPRHDFVASYEAEMNASIERVWTCLLTTDVSALPLVRFLFLLRGLRLPLRNSHNLMEEIRPYGFLELAARQYQEIVIGAIAKPWRHDGGVVQDLDTDGFLQFDTAGYVRIGANVTLTPLDRQRTLVVTETRVLALDERARRRFRAYWALVRRPSGLIRKAVLKDLALRSSS